MFFRDRGFWCSVVAAWAVSAFLALTGWWPSAWGWLAFLERWTVTTATIYALHTVAHVTIVGAIDAAAAKGER